MARMLATIQRNKINRCCRYCVFFDGRYVHLKKNRRFRKWARAADKADWKRIEA